MEWSSARPILAHVSSIAMGYVGVAVWLWLVFRAGARRETAVAIARRLFIQVGDAFCFGIVLALTLYIKLWVPLVRTASYDRFYDATDRIFFSWLHPFIVWRARYLQFNWIDQLYFLFFFGMFLVSFVIHNLRGRAEFRRVFLASLLVQGTGGALYFAAPAIGPFLYHPSANAIMASTEHYFYLVRQSEMTGGVSWLCANAGRYIVCGLAAMPSLHAAASFIFLYYAWRYVRPLAWIYTPLFIWILFEALASRWHYGIDLIVGIALACACIALSNAWMRAHEMVQMRKSPRTSEEFSAAIR